MANILNLLIDGNFQMHSVLNVINSKPKPGEPPFLQRASQQNQFISILTSMYGGLLEGIRGTNSRSCLCIDSRSFRKDINIEENGGYKSGREKNEDTDWKAFYDIYDKFSNAHMKIGGTSLRVAAAEADDLILLSSRKLMDQGESCIIISSDRDLKQLVRKHKGEYCVQYSTAAEKLYVPHDFQEAGAESLFDLGHSSYDAIIQFAKKKGVTIERIDAQAEALCKVLIGDSGDDVPPVYAREEIYKSGQKIGQQRLVKFNEKSAAQVIREVNNPFAPDTMCGTIWEDESLQESLAGMVLRLGLGTDNKESRTRVVDKIKRNLRLVWLDRRIIPQSILDSFELIIFSPAKMYKETKLDLQKEMGVTSKINFFEPDIDFDAII